MGRNITLICWYYLVIYVSQSQDFQNVEFNTINTLRIKLIYIKHAHNDSFRISQRKEYGFIYNNQSVNSVWRNNWSLFWESHETNKYIVWTKCRISDVEFCGVYNYHYTCKGKFEQHKMMSILRPLHSLPKFTEPILILSWILFLISSSFQFKTTKADVIHQFCSHLDLLLRRTYVTNPL